jgi:hypothetical protein
VIHALLKDISLDQLRRGGAARRRGIDGHPAQLIGTGGRFKVLSLFIGMNALVLSRLPLGADAYEDFNGPREMLATSLSSLKSLLLIGSGLGLLIVGKRAGELRAARDGDDPLGLVDDARHDGLLGWESREGTGFKRHRCAR